jgi:predicted pyridoxine 5'-phosphate oxidase superfamily flavin-nucleotide-binding protein
MTATHFTSPSGWDLDDSPFHQGERLIQEQLGVARKMENAGRHGIRRYMPDQHREFFSQLPFVVVAALDHFGQPWASLLCNPPGFIESPDPTHLTIRAAPDKQDPLNGLLRNDSPIGLLGIQPHTRRRNRANGRVINDETALHVEVLQSFGNCPKYIQARYCRFDTDIQPVTPYVSISNTLDSAMLDIIHDSDMFFIASAHPDIAQGNLYNAQNGVDVSHRGGKPGFVKVDSNALLVPDYIGNFFFNTLGNLLLNPRVGLVFIDFHHGTLLHLAVETQIVWDGATMEQFPGAQRLLRFSIKEARHVHRQLPLRWTGWELSPYLVDK